MGRKEKTYEKVMSGKSDSNIDFYELRAMLEWLGFSCRIKGDHFIYFMNGMPEIINIQPVGNKAKAYQVKQIRLFLIKYKIGGQYYV